MSPTVLLEISVITGIILLAISLAVYRKRQRKRNASRVTELLKGTLYALAGRRISKYKMVQLIGTGHTWLVYLGSEADDPSRRFIVRVLRPEVVDTAFEARLAERLQALSQTRHPAIISPIECSQYDGRLYVVQPYCVGRTLGSIMEEGPCPVPQAYSIVGSLMDSVHVHATMNVPLKRLDAHSVIVGDDGQVHIVDLGVHRGRRQSLIGMKTVVGELQAVLPAMDSGEKTDQLGIAYLTW
jgi:serine/threonine protein kinase